MTVVSKSPVSESALACLVRRISLPLLPYRIAIVSFAIAFGWLLGVQPAHAFWETAAGEPAVIPLGHHDPNRAEDVCDAAAQGDLAFLGALVRQGLEIDIPDDKGRTPLMCAQGGEVADFMIRHGADPNAADRNGYTVLHYHLWSEAALSLVPVLLNHGAKPQPDRPPLLRDLAVRFIEWQQYREGDLLLEMLVSAGWNVDERDLHGDTLLHVAAHNDNLPLAESVLRNGADSALLDREGRTAETIAREAGSAKVLRLLMNTGEPSNSDR